MEGKFGFWKEEDLAGLPSWLRYRACCLTVAQADDDPDKTMHVAMTMRDLTVTTFGLYVLTQLFPEMLAPASLLSIKLNETGVAQQFVEDIRGEDADEL